MQLKNNVFLSIGITLFLSIGAFWLIQREKEEELARQETSSQELLDSLSFAKDLLKQNRPLSALLRLQNIEDQALGNKETQSLWFELAVDAAAKVGDTPLLESLFAIAKEEVLKNEEASLKLAEASLLKGDFKTYSLLEKHFERTSEHKTPWALLKADALAIQGNGPEAMNSLNKKKFLGQKEESERLLRLALLTGQEHPKVAWEHLTNALRLDPNESDLYFYRATLLDQTAHKDLALKEYQTAIQKSPEDPFYQETLAESYLKKQNLAGAYLTVQEALKSSPSDRIWTLALFLNQIYKPLPFDFRKAPIPNGELTPLIRYLVAIPEGEFWKNSMLKTQKHVQELADTLSQTPWLELLESLKQGDLTSVKETLDTKKGAELNPELHQALQIAVAYQLNSPLNAQKGLTHPIFKQLEKTPYTGEMKSLLASPEVFAALFLAGGWYEAAIRLHTIDVLPADFPKWVALGMTKAIAQNQSPEKGIAFAKNQKQTPQLRLLIGELALQSNNPTDAVKELASLAKTSSEVGSRAALLLTQQYIKQGNFDGAKKTVLENEALASSTRGKELLARIALAQNQPDEAEKIYSKIAGNSLEAGSFFVAQAYQKGNYKQAYKLAKELQSKYPDSQEVKGQIALIVKAASIPKSTQN